MNIGILGGTFSPIHYGHLAMAETAYRELMLDEVLFMPSGNPPHKGNVISGEYRLEMVKLATDNMPYFTPSDYELLREGKIYTADTLTNLNNDNPDNDYTFILGADSFYSITKWYKPEIIMSKAVIAVCTRDNATYSQLNEYKDYLVNEYGARIKILNFTNIDVSSQEIRLYINDYYSNQNDGTLDRIKQFVPDKVIDYIFCKGLYRDDL